jgi:nucleotide-binding universal stress UspA family protein
MGLLGRLLGRDDTGDRHARDHGDDDGHGEHHLVVVRVPADPANPFAAVAYSGPVADFLAATGLGELLSAAAGAAHHKGPGGTPFVQLDLALHDVSDTALGRLIAELERLGAPEGSRLRTEHGEPVPFGNLT